MRPNQALPEGIPLGQADGCQLGTLNMASIGHYKIERTSVNSLPWVHIESLSRRTPQQKHLGINLAPVR